MIYTFNFVAERAGFVLVKNHVFGWELVRVRVHVRVRVVLSQWRGRRREELCPCDTTVCDRGRSWPWRQAKAPGVEIWARAVQRRLKDSVLIGWRGGGSAADCSANEDGGSVNFNPSHFHSSYVGIGGTLLFGHVVRLELEFLTRVQGFGPFYLRLIPDSFFFFLFFGKDTRLFNYFTFTIISPCTDQNYIIN